MKTICSHVGDQGTYEAHQLREVEVCKIDSMTRYLPDLRTESDLTRLQNEFK